MMKGWACVLLLSAFAAQAAPVPSVRYTFDENAMITSNAVVRPAFPHVTNVFSLVYWVKPLDCRKYPCASAWEKLSGRVMMSSGSGYYEGFRTGMHYGEKGYVPFFSVGHKTHRKTLTSSRGIPFDAWSCIIWIWKGATLKGYVNGEPIGETETKMDWRPLKDRLKFGPAGHGMPPLPMYLRSVDYYDCALSEQDVDRLILSFYPARKAARLTETGAWAEARALYATLDDGVKEEDVPYARIEPRVVPRLPETKNALYVSCDGADTASGTRESPLRSWQGALARIRQLRAQGLQGGMRVFFRGGEYRISQTVEITKEDSGSADFPIVFSAYGNEKPVFTGGFALPGFARVTDPGVLARLPGDEARRNVRVCDLASSTFAHAREKRGSVGWGDGGIRCVQDLYCNGRHMQLARYPNEGFLHATNIVDAARYVFRPCAKVGDLALWAREPHLMACGYWIWCWADHTDPIAVDVAEKTFRVVTPRKERMQASWNPNVYYFLLNALQALDREGEWYFDADTSKLYVWPRKRAPWWTFPERDAYVLSTFDQPFLKMENVSHMAFWGLTFTYGRGRAVLAKGCSRIVFARNDILNFGGEGFKMENARDTHIWGNRFLGFGRAAMDVSGGDRKTIRHSGIRIENNEIGLTSRTARTYTPGLRLHGCGTKVVYNHFHDILSSAMRLEGNDFLISMNRVERVVTESGDQGGVDIYNNPTYYGNVYSYNIWRKVGVHGHGQAGIRFDDRISGQIVYGNRFQDASDGTYFGGVQMNGGRRNTVDNNVFTDCGIGVSISHYTPKRWLASFEKPDSIRMTQKAVDIYAPPYTVKYPGIETLRYDTVQSNRLTRNVFVGKGIFVKASTACVVDAKRNWRFETCPDLDELARETVFAPLPKESEIGPYDLSR